MLRMNAPGLALAAALALGPTFGWATATSPPGRSGDVTIDFEDLAPGTRVDRQYLARTGLEFVTSPLFGGTEGVFPEVMVPPGAGPGGRVASIRATGGELRENVLWGKLALPARYVRLRVGSYGPATELAPVTLYAVDISGREVGPVSAATVVGGAGFATTLEVFSTRNDIAYFVVRGPVNVHLAVDDVTFDVPASVTPDFSLTRPQMAGVPILLRAGGTARVDVVLHRVGGFSDMVRMSATALPEGVTARFEPSTLGGTGDATIRVTLSASPGAPPVTGSLLVTGQRLGTALPAYRSRSVAVPVIVQGSYDIRVSGMEVTQGIQTYALPERRAGAPASAPVPYAGVGLAARGKTVVRVFGDLRTAPPEGKVEMVDAELVGERDGVPLAGSPLRSETGPRTLFPGPGTVTAQMRADPLGAFTFTLPPGWTEGSITLRARLVHPPPALMAAYVEGEGAAFRENDAFALQGVVFSPTRDVYVRPVELTVGGRRPRAPYAVFADAVNLIPVGDGQVHVPDSYWGSIDITGIAALNFTLFGDSPESTRGMFAASALMDWAEEGNRLGGGALVVGVYPDRAEIRARTQQTDCWFVEVILGCTSRAVAIVPEAAWALTVSHEMGHLLGRRHAGRNCPAVTDPVEWPPDDQGFLQGVGLDRRVRAGRAARDPGLGPYRIIAPPQAGTDGQWYDFMSYCLKPGSEWISVRGWQETLGLLRTDVFHPPSWWPALPSPGGSRSVRPAAAAAAIALSPDPTARLPRPRRVLAVRGFVLPSGQVQLTRVAPGLAVPLPRAVASEYRLVVRDRRGRVLRDVPARADTTRLDDGGEAVRLSADAPTHPAAASVEIVRAGTVLAHRVRNRRAPRVALTSPGRDVILPGCGSVEVTWRATGEGPLLVRVDYSADDGRTWRSVFAGPDGGRVDVPAALLTGSRAARLRVRVSDGFNETVAVSRRLRAVGSPPTARIESPANSLRIAEGAALYLSGSAFDDAQTPIGDHALEWSADGSVLGSGRSLSVATLPPGTHTIRLTARDAAGRAGTATATVTVVPRSRDSQTGRPR